MAKDGKPDSRSGDGMGDEPEDLDASASDESLDWLEPDLSAKVPVEEEVEAENEFRSDFGEVTSADSSDFDSIELGEPSHPSLLSDSGIMEVGEPTPKPAPVAEEPGELGAPAKKAAPVAEEPGELGAPAKKAAPVAEEPGELGAPAKKAPFPNGATQEPEEEPGELGAPTGVKKGPVGPTSQPIKKQGIGRMIAAIAATLLVATVPSFMIYRDGQARIAVAADEKKISDDRAAKADAAKKDAEEKALKAIADQKADDEQRLTAAAADKKAAEDRAADVQKAAEAKAAEDKRLVGLAEEAKAKAERERNESVGKYEATKKELESANNRPKDPDSDTVAPEKAKDPIQLIKDGKLREGVETIVRLALEKDDPDFFDIVIEGLDEWLRAPGSAQLLIKACNEAKPKDDPKRAAAYNRFRTRLSNAIGAKSAAAGGSTRTRATGLRANSAHAYLASARDGSPTPRSIRLVNQNPPADKTREEVLEELIKLADDDLKENPEDSTKFGLQCDIDKILACQELAGLLLGRQRFKEATGRYQDALAASQDGWRRLKLKTSPGQRETHEARVLKMLDEVTRWNLAVTGELQKKILADEKELGRLRIALEEIRAELGPTLEKLRVANAANGTLTARVKELEGIFNSDPEKRIRVAISDRDAARADLVVARRELAEAIRLRDEARRKIYEDASLEYASGLDDFSHGQYAKAEGHFTQAISWFPRDPRFFYFRGIVRHRLVPAGIVKSGEADSDIREGVRLERSSEGSFDEIAHVLHRMPNEVLQWVESIRHPARPVPPIVSNEVGSSGDPTLIPPAFCPPVSRP